MKPTAGQVIDGPTSKKMAIKVALKLPGHDQLLYLDTDSTGVETDLGSNRSKVIDWPITSTINGIHTLMVQDVDSNGVTQGQASINVDLER